MIKYLLVPLSTLLILFAGGCGYTSSDECNLREAQKCSTDACLIRALVYCEDHQGKQYSKAFREADKKYSQYRKSEIGCSTKFSERYVAKTGKYINPVLVIHNQEIVDEEYKECLNRID